MKNVEELQLKALEKLDNIFKEAQIAAILQKKGEEGISNNVLSCLNDSFGVSGAEVMSRFYFAPMEVSPEGVQYFVAMSTLSDELPIERVAEVSQAVGMLNYYIPYGAFAVDPLTRSVIYRITTPITTELSEEELIEEVDILAGQSLDMAERYCYLILQVAFQGMSVDDFMDTILNSNPEESEQA